MSESSRDTDSGLRRQESAELADYVIDEASPPVWKKVLQSRWFWITLVLLAALVATAVWGPRMYREAKARRALAILSEAREMLKKGDSAGAGIKFRAAMALAPGDERVLRGLYLVSAKGGDSAALRKLTTYLDDGTASPEELLVLAMAGLESGDIDLGRRALDALPAKLSPDEELDRALVRASLLTRDGKLEEARKLLGDLKVPGSYRPRVRLALARLMLLSPETSAEGVQELQALSADPGESGLLALRLLASMVLQKALPGDSAIPTKLRSHPKAAYADSLLAAQYEIATAPEGKAAVIGRLLEESKAGSLSDRLALANWLLRAGSAERVEELFSGEESASNADVVVARADALAATQRLVEARRLLKESQCPGLEAALRHLFLARLAAEMNEPLEAAKEWQAVHTSLAASPPRLVQFVANYAKTMGKPDEARRALQSLVERNEADAGVYVAFMGVLPSNLPAGDVLVYIDKLLALEPEMAEAKSDRAYLRMLMGRDVPGALAVAEELRQKKPDDLSYISVAALGRLLSGDAPGAASLYEGRTIPWDKAFPSARVVRAAVLFANGHPDEAGEILKTVNLDAMRPEERELILAYRKGKNSSGLPPR